MAGMIDGPVHNGRAVQVLPPVADPEYYKTYEIHQQLDEVDCATAYCPDFMVGFVTVVDTSTDLGQRQAAFIRGDKTRSHAEEQLGPVLVRFTFPPGTRCFAPPDRPRHLKPRDGEQVLIEYHGDWRGQFGHVINHTRAEHFIESWAENQDRLAEIARRG